MSIIHMFVKCFVCSAGIISGAFISVVVCGYVLNKLCEWSVDREIDSINKKKDQ